MATTARAKRTVAPKATTQAEVSATPAPVKASFFARAKTLIVKTAKRVVTFTKTVGRKVKTSKTTANYTFVDGGKISHGFKAKLVRAKTFAAAYANKAFERTQTFAKRAWFVALRPFLQGVAAGLAFCTVLFCALVAPVTTIVVLFLGAALFVLAARGLLALERMEHSSRFARIALDVLNVVAQCVRIAAYIFAAAFAALLCAASLSFAIFTATILVLAYLDVRGAGTIAFLVWCLFSGSWALGVLWLLWRASTRAARASEVVYDDVPAYSEIRVKPVKHEDVLRAKRAMPTDHVAVGTEEVADLVIDTTWADTFENSVACEACGTTQGALRVRSNALTFVTVGVNKGTPHSASNDMLCSSCYDAECEDNAIAMTGVSLRKRSVQVTLNAVGRAALPEVAQSKEDVTQVYWATVAWWRDRRNNHHDRQWDCFHNGKVVASVMYDHTRKVYRASALGKFLGTKTGEIAAKKLATDSIFDEANAVDRMVEALEGDATARDLGMEVRHADR